MKRYYDEIQLFLEDANGLPVGLKERTNEIFNGPMKPGTVTFDYLSEVRPTLFARLKAWWSGKPKPPLQIVIGFRYTAETLTA